MRIIAILGLIASLLTAGCSVPNLTHTPHSPASTSTPAPAPSTATCTEDMPCWNCHTMGNRVCGVPAWVNCNKIDGSEFPRQAAVAWESCYLNLNRYHSYWQYAGQHFEGHERVWKVVGPTTVYITRNGWWVTS